MLIFAILIFALSSSDHSSFYYYSLYSLNFRSDNITGDQFSSQAHVSNTVTLTLFRETPIISAFGMMFSGYA